MSRSKRSHGEGGIEDRGTSWRFELYLDGKTERHSVKQSDFKTTKQRNAAFEAWKIDLRAKAKSQAEAEAGSGSTTVGQLLDRFLSVQAKNVCSYDSIAYMVNGYLRPELGELDARSQHLLTQVEAYRDKRALQPTYKGTLTRNRTINLEVTYLKQALKLLRPEPRYLKITNLPTKDGVRRGLVTLEEYYKILGELEDYQKPVWCFSYYVGRRRSELLRLRRLWAKDALKTGILEVPGWYGAERITKNGEDSYIALYMDSMRKFLQWALERGDPACPYLFQRKGKRIHDKLYYEDFKEAEARLRMQHIHYHDTRRTAVTNMIEAGIPEEEAMAVSGHIDPRVFRKYRIVTKLKARRNVLLVGERMKAWHAEQEKARTDSPNIPPEAKKDDVTESGQGMGKLN